MNQTQDIQLIPDDKVGFEPLFKTDEEYRKFCDEFTAAVTPQLNENKIKRLKSEEAARKQMVG